MWESFFIGPLFNLLVAIYSVLPIQDFGLAVIGVVVLVRLIILPLSRRAVRTQIAMQKIQPEIDVLRKKHKGDKEAEARALLALWRDHKVNPFASILILAVQLPILIALYQVFLGVIAEANTVSRLLWPFMPDPGPFTPQFLGIVDLAVVSIPLAIIAAAAQFFQTKLMMPMFSGSADSKHSFQVMLARQMLYIGPAVTLLVLSQLPAVIGLYWAATSAWSVAEFQLVSKKQFLETRDSGKDNSKKK